MDPITEIGVGGIFAILLIKEILNFISSFLKKNEAKEPIKILSKNIDSSFARIESKLDKIEGKTDDILEETHEGLMMHQVRGPDGRPVWYANDSAIQKETLDAIIKIGQLLDRLFDRVERYENEIRIRMDRQEREIEKFSEKLNVKVKTNG